MEDAPKTWIDLEEPICEAANMAAMLTAALDLPDDNPDKHDVIAFGIDEVTRRIKNVKEVFYKLSEAPARQRRRKSGK